MAARPNIIQTGTRLEWLILYFGILLECDQPILEALFDAPDLFDQFKARNIKACVGRYPTTFSLLSGSLRLYAKQEAEAALDQHFRLLTYDTHYFQPVVFEWPTRLPLERRSIEMLTVSTFLECNPADRQVQYTKHLDQVFLALCDFRKLDRPGTSRALVIAEVSTSLSYRVEEIRTLFRYSPPYYAPLQ
jgi:hypothetical protein